MSPSATQSSWFLVAPQLSISSEVHNRRRHTIGSWQTGLAHPCLSPLAFVCSRSFSYKTIPCPCRNQYEPRRITLFSVCLQEYLVYHAVCSQPHDVAASSRTMGAIPRPLAESFSTCDIFAFTWSLLRLHSPYCYLCPSPRRNSAAVRKSLGCRCPERSFLNPVTDFGRAQPPCAVARATLKSCQTSRRGRFKTPGASLIMRISTQRGMVSFRG